MGQLKPKSQLALLVAGIGTAVAVLLPLVVGDKYQFMPPAYMPMYIFGWVASGIGWIAFIAAVVNDA